ncbi:metacaspase 5 [Strigomonas culicis]|uniref:Metacaspase 5 n=1 Tax=Strigomonas culicis TaxID=28005 RepID=S9TZ51_9TRYP|nr:metacaspase 5 [Strigomonas culicis]|eukprot:EPY21874.1 metacaspase 5 [Strigomonas culicis]
MPYMPLHVEVLCVTTKRIIIILPQAFLADVINLFVLKYLLVLQLSPLQGVLFVFVFIYITFCCPSQLLSVAAMLTGGYTPAIKVERPERLDVHEVKAAATSGINSFVPFETDTPYTGGKVRALFMGCNYTGQDAELSGCVNDVHQVLETMEEIDFPIQECAVLVDDPTFPNVSDSPTLENMKKYMAWLVADAAAGDVLYLHYSGHGGRIEAQHDTKEAYDSCVVPVDYQTKGTILDDDLFLLLVKPLPAGVRLTCVFDCCHSASMLDLPFSFIATADIPETKEDETSYTMKQVRDDNYSHGDVLMLSGCTDEGTSADVSNTATFGGDVQGAGGAATQGFCNFLENEHGAKYYGAIMRTRKLLSDKGFQQVPQLTSSKPLNLDKAFSLFGAFTVDDKLMDQCVPDEFKESAPTIDGIPPRFRHDGMHDFDPAARPSGAAPPRKHPSRWSNSGWAQSHPDHRADHRMGHRPPPEFFVPDLRQKKFVVNPLISLERFVDEMKRLVEADVRQPLRYYVGTTPLEALLAEHATMQEAYNHYKDEDEFLYITYTTLAAPPSAHHHGMFKRTHVPPTRKKQSSRALDLGKVPVIVERMDLPPPPPRGRRPVTQTPE